MGYFVYKHTAPNGKVYIGITGRNPEVRWKKGFGYRNNHHFTNAVRLYGWENFKHEILETVETKHEAELLERMYIASCRSNDDRYGYNKADGGKSNSGYHHSEKTKRKIAESLRGKKHTPERRKHNSESRKRLWDTNESYRRHMSAAHMGKKAGKESPLSKPVGQYTLSGELIKIHESTGRAEAVTGIDHRQIGDCCRGKQSQAHGFIWKYA